MRDIEDWALAERWRYAIKPGSWPKLLTPMLLGQAAGIAATGQVSWLALALGVLFTLFDGLFIVLLNDWGDQEVDRIKRQMFPDGCSPKTIPDGVLPAAAVLRVGALAGVGAVAVALVGHAALGRPGIVGAAIACLMIFVAYSLPPIQLNYRGGGELLEALGVGVALPWLNAYLQSGQPWSTTYEVFFGFAALSLASALASGLSDEQSDRAGGKRTFTTMWGNGAVRLFTETLLAIGATLWVATAMWRPDVLPRWGALIAALVIAYQGRLLGAISPTARTNQFAALKRYKLHLHHAIWYGALVIAAALLAPGRTP